jgi:hypothetical protein
MKRAWLATVIVTGFSLNGFCAPKSTAPVPSKVAETAVAPRDAKVEELVSSLDADLKLSKAQQEQVRAALTKTKADYTALQKEMAAKRQTLMNDTNARLAAILKADQKKKFEAAHGIDAQGRYTPSVVNK